MVPLKRAVDAVALDRGQELVEAVDLIAIQGIGEVIELTLEPR